MSSTPSQHPPGEPYAKGTHKNQSKPPPRLAILLAAAPSSPPDARHPALLPQQWTRRLNWLMKGLERGTGVSQYSTRGFDTVTHQCKGAARQNPYNKLQDEAPQEAGRDQQCLGETGCTEGLVTASRGTRR